MSMIELRASPDLCRTCDSTACKKGRKGLRGCPVYLGAHNARNSTDCLLCGRCVLLCDNESPRLLFRNPFVELVTVKGRELTGTFIIPFLAGSQWARYIEESTWYHTLVPTLFSSAGLSFTVLLALCFALFIGIILFGDYLLGIKRSSLPIHCSPIIPVLTPLAFSGELIYRLEYLFAEVGRFPLVVSRQFGLAVERFSFALPAWALTSMSLVILALGCLGSLYVTFLFKRRESKDMPEARSCWSLQILVGAVALVYLFLI